MSLLVFVNQPSDGVGGRRQKISQSKQGVHIYTSAEDLNVKTYNSNLWNAILIVRGVLGKMDGKFDLK